MPPRPSWSVSAIAVQPAATASSTTRSGVSEPSEQVECRCRSITAPSVPEVAFGRAEQVLGDRRPSAPWGPKLLNDKEVAPMGAKAISTEGLSKRYGNVHALESLDLEVAEGEVVGYLGPNGAGKTTTIRLLLGLIRPTAGRAEIFGLDCQHQVVEAHRHLAYVAGEASLWPSLTGTETLHLLGRVQGRVDDAYTRRTDPPLRSRRLQEGSRLLEGESSEADPRCRPDDASRSPRPGRADQWPRPVDGTGVSSLRPRGARARSDDLPVLAHLERG